MKQPKFSPWSTVQESEKICDSAYRVFTASHGGIIANKTFIFGQLKFIEFTNNRTFPKLRAYLESLVWNKSYVCFEEDCNWAIFHFLFNNFYDQYSTKEDVERTMKNWHYKLYEEFYNVEVPAEESYMKRKDLFQESCKGNWQNLSAIYSKDHKGFTEVLMGFNVNEYREAEQEITILVPSEEYASNRNFMRTSEQMKNYQAV